MNHDHFVHYRRVSVDVNDYFLFFLKRPFYTRTRNDDNSYYYSCRIESSIEINKNYYVVRNAGCASSRYTLKLSFIF